MAEPVRPSGWWYGLAGGVAVAGIIAAIVIFVQTFNGYVDKINDFERVDVPGSGTVNLDGTGGYTIYHEYNGASDDFFGPDVSEVTLEDPDGDQVTLEDYVGRVTYTGDSHEGVALFSFHADQPGEYQLSATGDGSTLAVGRGISKGLIGGIVGGFAAGGVGVVAGGVIALIVGIQRGRNKRSRITRMPGPPQAFGPPGAWAGPPGYPGGPGAWPQQPPQPPPPPPPPPTSF
jgi:hypothetical protein